MRQVNTEDFFIEKVVLEWNESPLAGDHFACIIICEQGLGAENLEKHWGRSRAVPIGGTYQEIRNPENPEQTTNVAGLSIPIFDDEKLYFLQKELQMLDLGLSDNVYNTLLAALANLGKIRGRETLSQEVIALARNPDKLGEQLLEIPNLTFPHIEGGGQQLPTLNGPAGPQRLV